MEERGMNERIRMLRRQSENTEPRICLERYSFTLFLSL